MVQRENQRVQLTKRLLKEGMLRLLQTKELDKINVSELCRESGINRATFYKHYTSPQNVLEDVAADLVGDLRRMEPEIHTAESSRKYMEDVCVYLYDRRDLMKLLLRCKKDEDLVWHISDLNRRFWTRYHPMVHELGMDETDVKLMVTYFSSGAYHLLRSWLLEDLDKTPQEVASLILRFIQR